MADFNPDQYLSEKTGNQGFNPDQYLSEKTQDAEEQPELREPSELSALATMAAKGLTSGLTGVAAGVGAAGGTAAGGKPDWESMKAAYQEALLAQKAKEDAARTKSPILGSAVELGTSLPTLAVGGSALKGLGMASKVAQGATLGAGMAASQYLGENADPTALGLAGHATVGGTLGGIGGKIGGALESRLDPEKLEVAGSKMAQEAMGMNSSKDLVSRYNPVTGLSERGGDVIKGTGKTAMEQGVLQGGRSNWYDNALDALDKNYQTLNPLLENVQAKLSPNISNIMDEVGPVTTKTSDVMQSVFDGVPQSSQRNLIIKKIGQQYTIYEQKLAQADGNLQALNDVKQELTTAATNLKPQIYNNGTASAEAELYKKMGGVVRQHIEDLASAADEGAGEQIHQVNNNIGRLNEILPSLKGAIRGGIPTSKEDLLGKVVGPLEGFAAKGLNNVSKMVQTPVGEIAQKATVVTPLAVTTSPFSQRMTGTIAGSVGNQLKEGVFGTPANAAEFPKNPEPQGTAEATKLSSSLYNATDESLKNVADGLRKTPGLEFYADHLDKAVDENNDSEKNRAIFLILQHPRARQLVTPINVLKNQEEKASNQILSRGGR